MTIKPHRTRMAPSPTGELHIGSLAMALKNYAWAKRTGGAFVLRVEDTDKVREVPGAIKRLQSVINAYGLDWDEGPVKGGPHEPYTQSDRLNIYRQHVDSLIATQKAYHCFCSPERLESVRESQRAQKIPPRYDQQCRFMSADEVERRLRAHEPHVIRLAVPANQTVTFTDVLRGQISFETNGIDDQVLLKSDGFPTYHLAVVVDDYLMNITYIMRGEEWISSVPKHVLLYQAFGWELPIFAHIPVFLNPDGKGKMSKRKGTVSAQSFLDRGFLPEAVLNFLMILGWSHPEQQEIMSLAEYIAVFDPQDVNPHSVSFDITKLTWLNGIYIRRLSAAELYDHLLPFLPEDHQPARVKRLIPLVHERLETLTQFTELTAFVDHYSTPPNTELIAKSTPELVLEQLLALIEVVRGLEDSTWEAEQLERLIRALQEERGWHKRQFFMMIRLATSGSRVTPPLFDTLVVIGQEAVIERLTLCITQLQDT
jgi:glutamyl-tRNA synthetase